MRDENPIRTLEDYSKPSHEGYRNTNGAPAREQRKRTSLIDTIRGLVPKCWIHHYMGGSYYSFSCLILSTGKDCETSQLYPDVPTTSWRISLRSMDSFQGLTPKSPSSWS
ncbi:hypothetical protein Tco_0411043 [Tanacetum coccineum]